MIPSLHFCKRLGSHIQVSDERPWNTPLWFNYSWKDWQLRYFSLRVWWHSVHWLWFIQRSDVLLQVPFWSTMLWWFLCFAKHLPHMYGGSWHQAYSRKLVAGIWCNQASWLPRGVPDGQSFKPWSTHMLPVSSRHLLTEFKRWLHYRCLWREAMHGMPCWCCL